MLKKAYIFIVGIILTGLIFYSCSSDDNNPVEPTNQLPEIEILVKDGLIFGLGSVIRINTIPSDKDGSVSEVRFFVDDILKQSSAELYYYDIVTDGMEVGAHSVEAEAVDNLGGSSKQKVSFSITDSERITVLIPQGEDIWEMGSSKTVTWADNITDNVKIDLYKAGLFSITMSASTESDGSFNWDVPLTLEEGNDYNIRITSTTNTSTIGESDFFGIYILPFIKISSPNGSENFMPGSSQIITWTDNIDENVKIELYKGAGINRTITASVASNGTYNWIVPADLAESNDYKIRITSVNSSSVFDESDGYFSISTSPSLELSSPNGGEIFNVGGTRAIKWTSNFNDKIKIELWKNDIYYKTVTDSAENKGSYNWFIPTATPLSNDYKVKIIRIENSAINDMSANFFGTGKPVVSITEPFSNITNSSTKVQWYGNSNDSTDLLYYYCATTDTTLSNSNALSALNNTLWKNTENNYAFVSFTMVPFNSSVVYTDSATYTVIGENGDTLSVQTKAVYSKLFVYGIDDYGAASDVKSIIYRRVNQLPKFPMVFSEKLGVKGFEKYWITIGSDSAQMVLPAETEFWQPIDFKWMGEDPDGYDVKLEFKWELWERTKKGKNLVCQSAGWSENYLSVSFDDEIFNWNKQGKYTFKVYVRDDALEESLNHATVNFEVFSPTFDKGILLIDDTDPTLYPPPDALTMGNPDAAVTRNFYEDVLEYADYKPEGEVTDSLSLYRVKRFEKGIEFIGFEYIYWDDDGNPATPEVVIDSTAIYRGVYSPSIRELIKYRLVIIVSDDRNDINGVDFRAEPPYAGYSRLLGDYLNAGGKAFLLGPSVLMGKFYSNGIPINGYAPPFKTIYYEDGDEASVSFDDLMSKYFGIYSITFPEQKTYYTVPGTSQTQYCTDSEYAGNYDFIGVNKYDNITDLTDDIIRIDSTKVNDYWYNIGPTTSQQGRIRVHALKDNGTVFTGVPTIEVIKGERIYGYHSIFDLDNPDYNESDYSFELDGTDTLKHYLWNKKYTTESFEIFALTSSFFTWTQEPVNYKWVIKTTPSYSGAKCLKSSDTLHVGDWMKASVTVVLNGAGSVSFAYKTLTTDSLVAGSGLNFLIDDVSVIGTDQLLWRGDKNWRKVTYKLPAGTHKLSWRYEKSGSALETDAVWIDYIDVVDEHYSKVLQKSGTVATRYIADGDQYRTAFFGLPTFFLDNSSNQVSDMFKAMIDWFDLEKDPTDNWKKR